MLHMHPKTIQRYLREGKLRASKIGKGWRVSGHDLSTFTESLRISPAGADSGVQARAGERVLASCVMDVDVDDREEAMRIVNALTAALNTKPREYGRSTMHAAYLEEEGKVRVTLWGGLRFLREMAGFMMGLTGEE